MYRRARISAGKMGIERFTLCAKALRALQVSHANLCLGLGVSHRVWVWRVGEGGAACNQSRDLLRLLESCLRHVRPCNSCVVACSSADCNCLLNPTDMFAAGVRLRAAGRVAQRGGQQGGHQHAACGLAGDYAQRPRRAGASARLMSLPGMLGE